MPERVEQMTHSKAIMRKENLKGKNMIFDYSISQSIHNTFFKIAAYLSHNFLNKNEQNTDEKYLLIFSFPLRVSYPHWSLNKLQISARKSHIGGEALVTKTTSYPGDSNLKRGSIAKEDIGS